ncbi:MAG: polysaccharide deacetylase family protein [Clostridia bacterium]|nr:polysaccharide deacetylase family protein [Clostridia bacterium]
MYSIFSLSRLRRRLALVLTAAVCLCVASAAAVTDCRKTAAAVAQASRRAVVPIVMYHGLLEDKGRQNTYVIDPSLLESDLQEIAKRGYTTVGIRDLLAFVEEGTPLPDKAVMLTFDDGYYNNYRYAYPLLQTYGMKAVISPIARWTEFYSDTPGEQNRPVYSHITFEQMRHMAESGLVEFGNHSYDLHHAGDGGRHGAKKLAGESKERYQALLREDLQRAQNLFAQRAGVTPLAFTYPYGAMSSEAVPVLKEMGFRLTFTCEERVNVLTASPDSLYRLGRYLRSNQGDSQSYFDRVFRAAQAARG